MMTRFSILTALFVFPGVALAGVDAYIGKPVLIQEVDAGGVIKNQYLDSFQREENGSKFISQSPDISSFSAFGICLNSDASPCSKSVTSKAEMTRAMSVGNGRRQIDASMVPPIQDFPIDSTTTVLKEEASFLTVKVDQKLFGGLGNQSATFRIKRVAKLSEVPHSFSLPEKDEPNRKAIGEVDGQFKNLSLGVVQLNSRPDGENLLGNSSGSGTGYFISANGLMMTNHHVINDFRVCMENLVCEIDFKQVIPDGTRRQFTAKATMLVVSEQHDFALLKVDLPKNLNFSYFNLERQSIGPDLMTLGYPGDIREENETRLTYSFGKLVGFHSRAYATSAYIYQGASGSPLLNKNSMNVVAILSNGAGNPIPGIGSPGLARPILLIDAEFGLSDYISGSKMTRVRSALSAIEASSSAAEATVALNAYQRERTYMGLNSLKRLMLTHSLAEVRIAIMKTLEKMKVIVGSSDVEDELLETNPKVSPKIFLPIKG